MKTTAEFMPRRGLTVKIDAHQLRAFEATPAQIFAQAAARPWHPAVVSPTVTLHYGELVQKACVLAERIQEIARNGTQPVVAVCSDQTVAVIIAALAAWKVGCGYLPLSPKLPAERLRYMLEEAGCGLCLTDSESTQVPEGRWTQLQMEDLTQHPAEAAVLAAVRTAVNWSIRPEDFAYVIYTSGSTGKPKPVAATHGNLRHIVDWYCDEFSLAFGDQVTQLASPTFDASIIEIWPALRAGATIHTPGRAMYIAPEQLHGYIRRFGINITSIATAAVKPFLEFDWSDCPQLRAVITGGDKLTVFPRAGMPFRLVNMYGPTECTVLATSGTVPVMGPGASLPTIGKPIARTEILLLGPDLRPTPPGESGEICIGGAGVSAGYLNRPDLTAERFIKTECSRYGLVYRTGDLGRWREDGELEFCGRADEQMKLRGYRIEPGEVLAALNSHAALAESFVTVCEWESEPVLVAYVVLKSEVTSSELRKHLSALLPDYEIPSRFVRLDALPFTVNGKVDRRALPPPAPERLLPADAVAGSNQIGALERALLEIWKDVLRLPDLSLEDDFFQLGGHSFTAARMLTRVEQVLGVKLPVSTIFHACSIRELAFTIREAEHLDATSAIVPLNPESSAPPFFLVDTLGGTALRYKRLATSLASRSLYVLRPAGGFSDWASLEELAAGHIRSIKTVQPNGPYALGGYSAGGVIAFEVARQLIAAGDSVSFLGLLDTTLEHSVWALIQKRQFGRVWRRLKGMLQFQLELVGKAGAWEYAYVTLRARARGTRNRYRQMKSQMASLLHGAKPAYDEAKICGDLLALYQPKPAPVPTVLFRTAELDLRCGGIVESWTDLLDDLRVRELSGGHYDILREPHLSVLARELEAALKQYCPWIPASQGAEQAEKNPGRVTSIVSIVERPHLLKPPSGKPKPLAPVISIADRARSTGGLPMLRQNPRI